MPQSAGRQKRDGESNCCEDRPSCYAKNHVCGDTRCIDPLGVGGLQQNEVGEEGGSTHNKERSRENDQNTGQSPHSGFGGVGCFWYWGRHEACVAVRAIRTGLGSPKRDH
jgi:hypothetical protein